MRFTLLLAVLLGIEAFLSPVNGIEELILNCEITEGTGGLLVLLLLMDVVELFK